MTNELTAVAAASEAGAIIDITQQANQPHQLELGAFYIINGPNGVTEIDLTGDQYRDNPARIQAHIQLTHADSLLAYWDKHADDLSEIYADRERSTITAILDAHDNSEADQDDRAGWQQHRATLTLAHSEPLKAWLARDNKFDTQVGFAEFIEDWMPVIAQPPAADLLEMAQQFQATTKATFKAGHKLVNGQRQFEYNETIDATVKSDAIPVPTTMTLRMPVWRGAATAEEFTARIRYRLNYNGPGQLGLGYKLDRPTDIIDAAFEAEISRIQEHVGRPVLRGTPAS